MQSRLIYQRIRDLAAEKNKTVLIFVEDVAASGGYMIAVAGDEIIADPSSIVGSIGVVSASFGFTEADRRSSASSGASIRPAATRRCSIRSSPEKPEDVERLKALQLEVHETFIDIVKERRGAKLKDDPDLFTGLFWTGKRGLELGLVDALGDMRSVLKDRFGPKTRAPADHPAARPVRPPAGLLRLERGHSPADIAGAAADGLDRCGGGARAVEPVRALKKPANRRYHGSLPTCGRRRPPAIEEECRHATAHLLRPGRRWPPMSATAHFVKEAERVTAKVRRSEKQAANGANGTLVKDPKTGEYRLAKD